MLKIMIVDDMKILRDCLKLAIQNNSDCEVIGLVGDGEEAVSSCRSLRPEVVLMDIMMPKMDGIEATKRIKIESPEIKVLILTSSNDRDEIIKAMECGADGYAMKDIGGEELVLAIKGVHMGLRFVHQNVFGHNKEKVSSVSEPYGREKDGMKQGLTGREKSVLELVAVGLTNEEIAQVLGISTGRVRNIVTDLISKLMLKNRTQLAIHAVRFHLTKE